MGCLWGVKVKVSVFLRTVPQVSGTSMVLSLGTVPAITSNSQQSVMRPFNLMQFVHTARSVLRCTWYNCVKARASDGSKQLLPFSWPKGPNTESTFIYKSVFLQVIGRYCINKKLEDLVHIQAPAHLTSHFNPTFIRVDKKCFSFTGSFTLALMILKSEQNLLKYEYSL